MRFTKMQGLGNDYLYVYGDVPSDAAELSIKWSDRHFGVGSDGIIWVSDSDIADFKMSIFNADGSEAMMCGNGVRCVGKFVYDKGLTDKTSLRIETRSGIRTLELQICNGKAIGASVDMANAVISDEMELTIDGETVSLTPISMGNPHAVIFVDDINNAPLSTLGKKIEKHSAFPDGVNVEFIEVLDRNKLRMRVWERGSGITMACGTGACASAVAAVNKGFCDFSSPITVTLDGGDLVITVEPDLHVTMTGPATNVCDGETM